MLEENDLGVTFDSRLQFSTHIAACTSKANQRIGLLRRNFKFLDEETFMPLYKALVRPILEYGNSVWKPYFKKDSELLEKVQRRSTKLVRPIKDKSYPFRLRQLRLPSLVYRRQRADMLQVYRILTEIDNVQIDQSIQIEKTSTRGHKFKIFKPRCKTNVKKNTLAYRAVNEWNALSNDVIEVENINQFKSKLEEYWHDKEYKYDPSGFHDY